MYVCTWLIYVNTTGKNMATFGTIEGDGLLKLFLTTQGRFLN